MMEMMNSSSFKFAKDDIVFLLSSDDHTDLWKILRHEASQQEANCFQETGGTHVV